MSLVPRWFSRFPKPNRKAIDLFNLGKFFDDLEDEMTTVPSGLSVSIDSEHVLWIKGDKQEEEQVEAKKIPVKDYIVDSI